MNDTAAAPGRPRLLQYALAVAALAIGATLALVSASGVAYSSDQGVERLREVAPALVASVLIGLVTVGVVRALVGRRAISSWLLLGALPAFVLTLNHLGVIGQAP